MDIMVDLETLGTKPDALIIAIGAVAFDNRMVRGTFYRTIDWQSAADFGGKVDMSTIRWWFGQSDEARKAILKDGSPIVLVLSEFTDWLGQYDNVTIWGNGATFDNVILGTAYNRLGIEKPWKYNADRCYRTVKELYPEVPRVKPSVAHNALADALAQAEHLINIQEVSNGKIIQSEAGVHGGVSEKT